MSEDHSTPNMEPDLATFRAFYEAHIAAIYRFVYSKVGNREEAEDITALVFTKALRGVDWSRDEQTRQRWLFQVARTTIADHWREVYRLKTTSLDDLLDVGWEGPAAMGVEGMTENLNASSTVEVLLAQLSRQQAEVLRCRFLRNYSIKETAQYLGLSEANVKVVQFRALKRAAQLRAGSPVEKGAPADE